MYHHEDHDCYATNKIYHFYLNGFVTNLSINTKEEGSVDCHKVVLVAMSEYFRLMFDVGSADVDINVLELNTTSSIVKDIIQFIYKGTTDIHNDCKVLCMISEVPQHSPPIVYDIVQYMLCMHAVSTSRKLYVLIFVTIYFEVSKYNLNMKFAVRYLLIGI